MGGRFRGRITGIMVCAVVALCARQGLHGHPDGVSVAINFAADEPNGARSDVMGSAGVLRTENWNNVAFLSGAQEVDADDMGQLVSTGVTVQWTSNNTWSSTGRGEENNTAPFGDDRNLMTGYLDTTALSVTSVSVSGLAELLDAEDRYTVYVYIKGGVSGRGGDYAIAGQVQTVVGQVPFDGTYTEGQDFIVFGGLSGSSFTLTATPTTGTPARAPINAIEIVIGEEVERYVPTREITPAVDAEDCAPGGRGPLAVEIQQPLAPGLDAGETIAVVDTIRGALDAARVTAGNGGTVESVYPTGLSAAGFINAWLLLGPFAQLGGDMPGDDIIRLDYLTDGLDIEESSVRPVAGDTVETDFGMAAASTGLLPAPGLNPDGVPTWAAVILPAAHSIDLTLHYGSNVDFSMTYAVTYVHVEADIEVTPCVGSDDSVQIIIDEDQEIYLHNGGRGTGGDFVCQNFSNLAGLDLPPEPFWLTAGFHRVMVKVFQGGGGHGFRLGFRDAATGEPAEGITVCLDPDAAAGECLWEPVGARVNWNVTRGQLVGGVSYTADVLEGRFDFAGLAGGEAILGANTVNLDCVPLVASVACAEDAAGNVTVTWENHPHADTNVPIVILLNGVEVTSVAGDQASVTVDADSLTTGYNVFCVVNSSGAPVCCAVLKDSIMVSDLVAGGDGDGSADPLVVGINADTGMLEYGYLPAGIPNTGANPQPVPVSPYIDSVFILDAATTPINTAGVVYDLLPFGDYFANTYDHILKDVTHDIDKDITAIWAGGRSDWITCVAIHAAAGITFDLDALRSEYGELETFACFAGTDQCASVNINMHVLLSDDQEVLDIVSLEGLTVNTGEMIELEIPGDARFLTLIVGAGNSDISCDHGVFANPVITIGEGGVIETRFRRGDVNADGALNIADAIALLSHLFAGAAAPPCLKAADANDDGALNIADAITILSHLFGGAGDLPPPFTACGPDPSNRALTCESFPPCR